MGFKIVWSPKSEQTFDKIISYLAKNWTEKEIKHLTLETERVIHLLKQTLIYSEVQRNMTLMKF